MEIWTFIVLVGPEKEALEVYTKGKNVTGPERGFLHLQVDENPGEELQTLSGETGAWSIVRMPRMELRILSITSPHN